MGVGGAGLSLAEPVDGRPNKLLGISDLALIWGSPLCAAGFVEYCRAAGGLVGTGAVSFGSSLAAAEPSQPR